MPFHFLTMRHHLQYFGLVWYYLIEFDSMKRHAGDVGLDLYCQLNVLIQIQGLSLHSPRCLIFPKEKYFGKYVETYDVN